MKKLVGLFVLALVTKFSVGQWTTSGTNTYTTNRIGIGTAGTPTTELDVFKSQAGPTVVKVRNQSTAAGAAARFDLSTATANSYQISALHENGGLPIYQFSVGSGVKTIYFDGPQFAWRNAAGSSTWLAITTTGNIGIGTAATGSFKLAVEGTIGTREIKVTSVTPFPDYVFKSDYTLRSIRDVENYISKYQHLPGIPSAKEVEDAGGFELGEMNKKLLEKVEELTLYIIELNKRIEDLEKNKNHK